MAATAVWADRFVGGRAGFGAKFEAALARPAIWAAAVGAVLLLQAVLTVTHRPWLDEYQALQIAMQSPDLTGLAANLRYEGHPPLWYLLLRGVGAIAPLPWILPLVAVPLAWVTQAVILFRAPFARLQRLAIATSEFVLFEYDTISRSLTLGVTLLLLAFAFRDRRWGWVPLALLPMADFLFGVLSIVLIVIRFNEGRLWRPGVVGWFAVSVVAAWSTRPAIDIAPALIPKGAFVEITRWVVHLSVLLVPVQVGQGGLTWNYPFPPVIASIIGLGFVVLAWRQLRHDNLHLMLWTVFAGLTLAFCVFCYPLPIRHLSLLALLLILLRWRAAEQGIMPDTVFRLWLAGLSLCGLLSVAIAVYEPFDTSPEAAATIKQLGLTNAHWVSFPDEQGQGVRELLGIRFDKLGRDCAQDFVRWDVHNTIKTPGELARALRRLTARYGRLQLVSAYPLHEFMPISLVRPIAAIPPGYDGQPYYLYTVGAELSATTRRPPPCVLGQRPLRQPV